MFRLADSETDRHIVEKFSQDESQLMATVLAIPDYRLEPSGKTVITLEEGAKGSPEAVHAWFYPGDQIGQEFVYPRDHEIRISAATGHAGASTTSGKPNQRAEAHKAQSVQPQAEARG